MTVVESAEFDGRVVQRAISVSLGNREQALVARVEHIRARPLTRCRLLVIDPEVQKQIKAPVDYAHTRPCTPSTNGKAERRPATFWTSPCAGVQRSCGGADKGGNRSARRVMPATCVLWG
jgi:hypothetical protein